jgi:DNA polymerase III alpha subunit
MAHDIEVVLFPSVLQQTLGMWQKDNVVIIKGKLSDRSNNGSNELKILADDARVVTHEQAAAYQPTGKKTKAPKASVVSAKNQTPESTAKLYIRIRNSDDHATLTQLKDIIDQQPGNSQVVLVVGKDNAKQALRLPGGINLGKDTAISSLKELVGPSNVVTR